MVFREQHWRYEVAAGEDFEQTFDDLQRGIQVDNLSQEWLYVATPLGEYVPPLTLGWSAPLIPAQRTVRVSSVAGPSGGISSDGAGSPYVVHVFNVEVAQSQGQSYGSVRPIQSSGKRYEEDGYTTSGTAGTTLRNILIPAQPNQRIRVFSVACGLGINSGSHVRVFFEAMDSILSTTFATYTIAWMTQQIRSRHIDFGAEGVLVPDDGYFTVVHASPGTSQVWRGQVTYMYESQG